MATQKRKRKRKGLDEGNKALVPSPVLRELGTISKGISGMIMMRDAAEATVVPTIFTSFNRAIQVGGAPTGCIWLLHGPWGGGKTALAVAVLKSFQMHNHLTCFVDAEHTAETKRWFPAMGIDTGACLYYPPDTYEETADAVGTMLGNFRQGKEKGNIHPGRCLAIAVDSITKLVPKEELKKLGEVGKAFPLRALMNSSWLNRLTGIVGRSQISFIILAQESIKIDAKKWEKKYRVKGGEQMWFDSTICVRIDSRGFIYDVANPDDQDFDNEEEADKNKVEIGQRHRFRVEKNKVGVARDYGYFFTSTGRGEAPLGFDLVREVKTEAISRGLIKQTGSYFSHDAFDNLVGLTDGSSLKNFVKNGKCNGKANLRKVLRYGIHKTGKPLVDIIRKQLDREILERLRDGGDEE